MLGLWTKPMSETAIAIRAVHPMKVALVDGHSQETKPCNKTDVLANCSAIFGRHYSELVCSCSVSAQTLAMASQHFNGIHTSGSTECCWHQH